MPERGGRGSWRETFAARARLCHGTCQSQSPFPKRMLHPGPLAARLMQDPILGSAVPLPWCVPGTPSRVALPGLRWHRLRPVGQPCHLSRAPPAVQGEGWALAPCWHRRCPGTRRQCPLPAWHELPAELSWAWSSLRRLINPDLHAEAAAQGPPSRLPRLMCLRWRQQCPRGGQAELFRSTREGERELLVWCGSALAVPAGCQLTLTHQGGPAWHGAEPWCWQ